MFEQMREAPVFRPGVSSAGARPFIFEHGLYLRRVIGIPPEHGIDFAECKLRVIERQFLRAPTVGDVLTNEVHGFELRPCQDRLTVGMEGKVFAGWQSGGHGTEITRRAQAAQDRCWAR